MSKPDGQLEPDPGGNRPQFEAIYFEISGTCNAKCPWCSTGRRGQRHGKMMRNDDFRRCVERLEQLRAVHVGDTVQLYNWGEPTLNPSLDDMLAFLGSRGLRGEISTNAIKTFLPSAEAIKGLGKVSFSVSGMTDRSEILMHGVSARRVLENMNVTLTHLSGHGWRGPSHMAFHIYQHNINEVAEANDWAERHGMQFTPYFAFLNDFYLAEAYLAGCMDRSVLLKASKELMLFYVDELISKMPSGWPCCLRRNQLVIDENCNVRTCCVLPVDHAECALGSIFDLGLEEIKALKGTKRVCAGCEKSGLAWWVSHVQGGQYVQNMIDDHQMRVKIHNILPQPVRRLLGSLGYLSLRHKW